MKALDLFCGLGGWSDGLAVEGFDVTGVEIEPKIAKLYNHPVIVADVCDLDPIAFTRLDLIVGSPPCRNFTRIPDHALRADGEKWGWKEPKNPVEGLRLVKAFLNFIEVAKPRYWLMENVPGLCEYLPMKPKCRAHLSRTMVRCFWGNYPPFLIPTDLRKRNLQSFGGTLRAWERAKIPMPVARALGQSILASEDEVKR